MGATAAWLGGLGVSLATPVGTEGASSPGGPHWKWRGADTSALMLAPEHDRVARHRVQPVEEKKAVVPRWMLLRVPCVLLVSESRCNTAAWCVAPASE